MHITACIRGIAITTNNTDLLCVVGAVIVLEQPLQRHPALNVLVVECCVVVFALERAVPVVLDAVVCPSRQQLSNHCPLVAMCLPQRNSCPQKEVARVRAACHHRHVAVHSSNYEDHLLLGNMLRVESLGSSSKKTSCGMPHTAQAPRGIHLGEQPGGITIRYIEQAQGGVQCAL